jgi:hypothetical protein
MDNEGLGISDMVEATQAEQFLPLPLTSWPLSR